MSEKGREHVPARLQECDIRTRGDLPPGSEHPEPVLWVEKRLCIRLSCSMQIIESSALGVRSARMTFVSPDRSRSIVLFPMVHVGDARFYQQVFSEASNSQVILVEGVRSPIVRRITRSYRWISGSRMTGLQVQPTFEAAAGLEVIRADLSEEEFGREWKAVPLWIRLLVAMAAPLIGLHRRWFFSRERLAKAMGLEDALSREEIISWSPEGAFLERAILQARDDELIRQIDLLLSRPSPPWKRASVIYGARHMRRVIRELTTTRGFTLQDSQWLTIFNL